jgi:hypothetical protein
MVQRRAIRGVLKAKKPKQPDGRCCRQAGSRVYCSGYFLIRFHGCVSPVVVDLERAMPDIRGLSHPSRHHVPEPIRRRKARAPALWPEHDLYDQPPPAPASPLRQAKRPADDTGVFTPIEFTGTAGEYFGIWIVNILLTIVTVGFYSAWAKVRRKRYFYPEFPENVVYVELWRC